MKISLIKKGILVILPIRFISFRLVYFSGRKGNNAGPEAIMQVLEVIMQVPEVIMQVLGSNNVGPESENADSRKQECRSMEVIMQVPEAIFWGWN